MDAMPSSRFPPAHPPRRLFLDIILPQAEEIRQAKRRRIELPKIFVLPDELLLQIARHIDGRNCRNEVIRNIKDWRSGTLKRNRSRDLRNLTLTCKKLAPIGREALIASITISRMRVRRLLLFLLQYPELVNKVTRIHLIPPKVIHDIYIPVDPTLILRLAANRSTDSLDKAEMINLSRQLGDRVKFNADCTPILLALCPNLRDITVGISCLAAADLLAQSHAKKSHPQLPTVLSSSWPPTVASLILDNLTVVNIVNEDFHWSETQKSFELRALKNLRSLSMPFVNSASSFSTPILWYQSKTTLDILPPSLQYLTLYVDNVWGTFLYDWLGQVFSQAQYFAALKMVRLYTQCPLETNLTNVKSAHLKPMLKRLSSWTTAPIAFQTFFLPVADYDWAVPENYEQKDWRLHIITRLEELEPALKYEIMEL
ncbi:hypothetical protein N0V90_010063 [Kalmusia sp. IMI 367209]|nr:hypothetical protein N0V90_010063 [Kalmusia sp. IMI 367209]